MVYGEDGGMEAIRVRTTQNTSSRLGVLDAVCQALSVTKINQSLTLLRLV